MSDYLIHHGILGQKWGVRRYQNEDGTLTKEGRARYGVSELPKNATRKDLKRLEKDQRERMSKAKDTVSKRMASAENKERIDRINSDAAKIIDESDEVGKAIRDELSRARLTQDDIAYIKRRFKEDVGSKDQIDDDELFSMLAEDYADEILERIYLNDAHKDFFKKQDSWWDDVHSLTDSIAGEFKDGKISVGNYTVTGSEFVKGLLDEKIDTHFMSYIWRHFDDYWIQDTDEYYDAESRLKKEIEKLIRQ